MRSLQLFLIIIAILGPMSLFADGEFCHLNVFELKKRKLDLQKERHAFSLRLRQLKGQSYSSKYRSDKVHLAKLDKKIKEVDSLLVQAHKTKLIRDSISEGPVLRDVMEMYFDTNDSAGFRTRPRPPHDKAPNLSGDEVSALDKMIKKTRPEFSSLKFSLKDMRTWTFDQKKVVTFCRELPNHSMSPFHRDVVQGAALIDEGELTELVGAHVTREDHFYNFCPYYHFAGTVTLEGRKKAVLLGQASLESRRLLLFGPEGARWSMVWMSNDFFDQKVATDEVERLLVKRALPRRSF